MKYSDQIKPVSYLKANTAKVLSVWPSAVSLM